jgi:dihydrofolate reductase
MRKIIYYVAMSLDGFIDGHGGSIEGFVGSGSGLEKYLADIQDFDTVIMGRKTYEFGYKFGLKPGQPAYPHMQHFIFSSHLTFETQSESVHIKPIDLDEIRVLKQQTGTDIYLCGGGQFAGWLLENDLIDVMKIKLNPLLLGQGVRLFGNSTKFVQPRLVDTCLYDHGLQIITYSLPKAD